MADGVVIYEGLVQEVTENSKSLSSQRLLTYRLLITTFCSISVLVNICTFARFARICLEAMLYRPTLCNVVRSRRILMEVDSMTNVWLDVDLNIRAPTEGFDGRAGLVKQAYAVALAEDEVALRCEPENWSLEGARVIVQGTLGKELANRHREFGRLGVLKNSWIKVGVFQKRILVRKFVTPRDIAC